MARQARLPGLDGLRGLAVALVVAYHLGWLRGGWLGVDVFFVLSGYLITALLLGEHDRSGRVDLRAFWMRRARRLVPALLVVVPLALVAAMALGWPPTARRAAAIDGAAALTWWSNWRSLAVGGYWASVPSLFRHAWSLGIEEQFYVAWPLLFIGSARLARKVGRSVRSAIAATAGAGILASATWSLVLASRLPDGNLSRVYVGTDARALTPLTGCLLAALLSHRAWGRAAQRLLTLLSVASGAALLVLAATTYVSSRTTYSHGVLILIAVLAAGVVPGATIVGRIDPVTSWLGTRSYGIYLISWPLQVLVAFRWDWMSRVQLTLAVVPAALLLAEVSYQLVEAPIRYGRWWATRPRLRWASLSTAGFGALLSVTMVAASATPPPVHTRIGTDESIRIAMSAPLHLSRRRRHRRPAPSLSLRPVQRRAPPSHRRPFG